MSFTTEGVVKEVIGLCGAKGSADAIRIKIDPTQEYAIKREKKTYAIWVEVPDSTKGTASPSPTPKTRAVEAEFEYFFDNSIVDIAMTGLHSKKLRLRADAFAEGTAPKISSADLIG